MAKPDNGGPAFPEIIKWPDGCFDSTGTFKGMSLRDYFAIHATDKDIESFREFKELPRTKDQMGPSHWEAKYTRTEARYRYADAMLVEREKEKPNG